MRTFRAWLVRVAGLFRTRAGERDLDAELQAHLELHIADNVRAGMPPDEARRRALITLGGIGPTKERYRERRQIRLLAEVLQDFRFAARLLARDRGFAAIVVLVLGVGIAVTNTFLVLTYAICVRGLPIDAPERVLFLRTRDAAGRSVGMSFEDFTDLRQRSTSFSNMAAFIFGSIALGDDVRGTERFRGNYVSADTFRLLGEVPVAGRDFEPQDDRPGAPSVVILGTSIWTSRYSRDPSIVGSVVRVNGVPSTIIGIMPDRSKFPMETDVWQPLAASAVMRESRDTRTLAVVARVRDDISVTAARDELTSIWSGLQKTYPDLNGRVRLEIIPINRQYAGDINNPAWWAFITAGFLVLVVACANVANLLLMRGAHRARELAIRGSLGATRWRMIRQLLTESILLGMLGGAVGIGLALMGVRLLWAMPPAGMLPYWMRFDIDVPVLAIVVALCFVSSLVFGTVPALQITRGAANLALKGGRQGAMRAPSSRRWTSAFLAAQFSIALMFLGTLSVATRLLDREDRDPHIDAEHLLTVWIALPPQKYATPEQRTRFHDALGERLAAVPALQSVAMTRRLPLEGATGRQLFIEGAPVQTAQDRPRVSSVTISPSYFETLGVSLLRGRAFDDRDGLPGHDTVIVNQRFVDLHFPRTDPIGKRIGLAGSSGAPGEWLTIIGVSPNIRQQPSPVPDPVVYVSLRGASPEAQFAIIARAQDPLTLVPIVRSAIRSIDPDVPMFRILTLDEAMREATWNRRLSSLLANFITALALLLSAIGLYALISHAVAQLTPEIGVRIAMGAQPRQIAWTIFQRALTPLAMGVAGGVLLAVGSSKLVASDRSGGLMAGDLLVAALILGFVSLLATLLPTMRALRVNPAVALRDD
jgi:putative ABC transport system permease protein